MNVLYEGILKVHWGIIRVLWRIKSYKSISLGYTWGIVGVPRGVVGILMSHLGIKSFKFVCLGYLWGYIGYEL